MGREGAFTTLDGQSRAMLPDDLLIWNQEKPVAVAGVMGGLDTEVRDSTRRVLLESANFKGSRIRRTSVRLDLRTESAQRFEKSQPPISVKLGIARILKLVADASAAHGGLQVTSRFTCKGDLKDRFRPLAMPRARLHALAGKVLPDDEVVGILQRLGFQARFAADGTLEVGIPPHRSEKDISIPEDIVEEVLRIYGYGRIEPKMPEAPIEPLGVETSLRVEHKLRRLLATGHAFVEVQNYGWFDDDWLARLGFQPGETLVLKNPAAQPNGKMRTTLVPNLLALVRPNRAHRDRFRLFEIGHVYRPTADGRCDERNHLAGVSFNMAGQPSLEEHFRQIKGALEDLATVAGCGPFSFVPQSTAASPWQAPWQAPGHWVEIRLGDRPVGQLGVLAKATEEIVALEGQVVWFEVALDAIEGPIFPSLVYVAPPIYPGSWQDFSLVWDVAAGYQKLEQRLDAFSHPLVLRREFVTVYKGKGLPPGQGSYSFRYWLGRTDGTLSSEEIEQFHAALLAFLDSAGIPLRA
jgi:phenylalanyl-tRNA synthetase beta chain